MIHININENISTNLKTKLLEQAALAALKHQGADKNAELTLVLTDDAQLHELNRDFLDVNAPTDVLSFPADQDDPESGSHYIGDILLSVERTEAQAQSAGHSADDEAQLLVVHGVLHLLGHDHAEAEEKQKMWKAQGEILAKLGLGHVKISEE